MPRLIDADEMQEKAFQMNFDRRINERELFLFNRALSEMPTIDAVPVVHGEWIKHNNPNYSPFDDSGEYLYQCNKCGMVEYRARHYCPNCGAKMDGERKEKENV